MSGFIALFIVVAAVGLMLYSKNSQGKKFKEGIKELVKGEILYGGMCNLNNGSGFTRGYLALTDSCIYFASLNGDKVTLSLTVPFEEVLTHKMHFVIFIESADHHVYEFKPDNAPAAYAIIEKNCSGLKL